MSLILSILWRLIVISFALLIALLAASMILAFGLSTGMFAEVLGPENYAKLDETDWGYAVLAIATFGVGVLTSFKLASLALLPVIIAIAVTEMMRWQGMVAQLLLGGASALFVVFTQLPPGKIPGEGTLIVTLAMGFVGAFFYWLIAGRGAGNWQSKLPALREQNTDGESRENTSE